MTPLVVAPCNSAAATHAVMNWHYSRRMPIGKIVRFGAWEGDRFVGVVLFARGASPHLGTPYGLDMTECVELVRVALRDHEHPVTEIVAAAMRQLRQQSPGVRAVVSFADPKQNHHGGIYQAGNWIYTGESAPAPEYFFQGRWRHVRALSAPSFTSTSRSTAPVTNEQRAALPQRMTPGKHRYIYPLDRAIRRRLQPLSLPYPHAVQGSEVSHQPSRPVGRVRSPRTAPEQ